MMYGRAHNGDLWSSPLDSPALGSGLQDLARPCGDDLRPGIPPSVTEGPTFGLTFSGGGLRATFAALGVVRYLADARCLESLRYVSSVSGGSFALGMLAKSWPALLTAHATPKALDDLVVAPITAAVTRRSLKYRILRNLWRTVGPSTRTDVLKAALDDWFFKGLLMEDLDPRCRWIVNASNLTTGTRFTFERDVFGDYVTGLSTTTGSGITLAQAIAASAAVPGLFATMKLRGAAFPCPEVGTPSLLDGGAYDNSGLEALDSDAYRHVFTLSMSAGGLFVTGRIGKIPIVRDLSRVTSILYHQTTSLRSRWMIDRFRAADSDPTSSSARRGILVGLSSDLGESDPVRDWRDRFPELRKWDGNDLASIPTSFDKLDEGLCRALIYRGWWLTGAAFARYYPTVAPLTRDATPPAT